MKACFVGKGFTWIYRIDFKNTFSPVARFETVRLLLSITVLADWNIEVLDVKMTFLFGELDEEIYMKQPEGPVNVKTWIGLQAETPETQSSLGRGTWPQLMCCALVAVQVPEVGRGRVGASKQGGSLDSDQDSE